MWFGTADGWPPTLTDHTWSHPTPGGVTLVIDSWDATVHDDENTWVTVVPPVNVAVTEPGGPKFVPVMMTDSLPTVAKLLTPSITTPPIAGAAYDVVTPDSDDS